MKLLHRSCAVHRRNGGSKPEYVTDIALHTEVDVIIGLSAKDQLTGLTAVKTIGGPDRLFGKC